MTIKYEAAYHEASHAVLAYKSKFHSIVFDINLANYGGGETFVSLSKKKCINNGLKADPSTAKIKTVAIDLAVILCGGLVGEKIAASRDSSIKPNPSCALPDHELVKQVLHNANISKKLNKHEKTAQTILEENWIVTIKVAEYLYKNIKVPASDIIKIIENG